VVLRSGTNPKRKVRRVTRDRLLEDLRWLAEGNPKYAGTSEEGRQNVVIAHLEKGGRGPYLCGLYGYMRLWELARPRAKLLR
jgi:hypothetical protein